MKYLNLGCGSRFHPSWTNVDVASADPEIIACDLRNGINFPDASFDVVYHSHVLEHVSKKDSMDFVSECFRVLRAGGVLRVVVPDFEKLVGIYLETLQKALNEVPGAELDHEWIMLHLYDQTTRNKSGGEMISYISRENIENEKFVVELWGVEGRRAIEEIRENKKYPAESVSATRKMVQRLHRLRHFRKFPYYFRELLLKVALGKEYDSLQAGRFRRSGEVHQWMYDRYSLSLLLEKCGFAQIIQRTATDSYIPNWSTFNLDTEPDGTVYRPDSVYMEAIKP